MGLDQNDPFSNIDWLVLITLEFGQVMSWPNPFAILIVSFLFMHISEDYKMQHVYMALNEVAHQMANIKGVIGEKLIVVST